VSLLFQPRCLPPHPAEGTRSYRSSTGCEERADLATGDPAIDLERLSRALAHERLGRDDAFSEVEFSADTEVVEGAGCTEWSVTARRIGREGGRITLRGVTVAEFSGERIASFRQYWDEVALHERSGRLPRD
jgi:ketosteroid isomerase-like protein